MKGGDGYSMNVLQPIAGRPSFIRYTDNCRPVFNGSLLQNGGFGQITDYGYYNDPTDPVGKMGSASPMLQKIENAEGPITGYNKNQYENFMILDSTPQGNTFMSGGGEGGDCGCNKKNKKDDIFDLLKEGQGQSGGFVGTTGLDQFAPIQILAKELAPMGVPALTSMIVLIFLHHYIKKRSKVGKGKMMGGFSSSLESVLAPLGRNNLLVMASILLLHHYAILKYKGKKTFDFKGGKKQTGGMAFNSALKQLLAPLGVNSFGSALILVGLHHAFMKKIHKKTLMGGSKNVEFGEEIRNKIKNMDVKKFMAGGIMKSLEGLFDKKMKMEKEMVNEKKMKYKKEVEKKFNNIFDMIAPVTFSTFATKDSLKKSNKIKSFILHKNKKL